MKGVKPRKHRFSLRKISVGVGSVCFGSILFLGGSASTADSIENFLARGAFRAAVDTCEALPGGAVEGPTSGNRVGFGANPADGILLNGNTTFQNVDMSDAVEKRYTVTNQTGQLDRADQTQAKPKVNLGSITYRWKEKAVNAVDGWTVEGGRTVNVVEQLAPTDFDTNNRGTDYPVRPAKIYQGANLPNTITNGTDWRYTASADRKYIELGQNGTAIYKDVDVNENSLLALKYTHSGAYGEWAPTNIVGDAEKVSVVVTDAATGTVISTIKDKIGGNEQKVSEGPNPATGNDLEPTGNTGWITHSRFYHIPEGTKKIRIKFQADGFKNPNLQNATYDINDEYLLSSVNLMTAPAHEIITNVTSNQQREEYGPSNVYTANQTGSFNINIKNHGAMATGQDTFLKLSVKIPQGVEIPDNLKIADQWHHTLAEGEALTSAVFVVNYDTNSRVLTMRVPQGQQNNENIPLGYSSAWLKSNGEGEFNLSIPFTTQENYTGQATFETRVEYSFYEGSSNGHIGLDRNTYKERYQGYFVQGLQYSCNPDYWYNKTIYIDDSANQVGTVKFVVKGNEENPLYTTDFRGKTGQPFNWDPASKIAEYERMGYTVINKNGYDKNGTFDAIPDNSQDFVYELEPIVKEITEPPVPGTPVDPNKPDGPKWPNNPSEELSQNKFFEEVRRTTTYVIDDNGTERPAGIDAREDQVSFKRKTTINLVAGQVGSFTPWEAQDNGDNTFDGASIPLKQGYIVTRVTTNKDGSITTTNINEIANIQATDPDVVEKVVYKKLGSWIPNIPTNPDGTPVVPGKDTPIPYPNDPNGDPKRPGTPTDPDVPVIPYVPGYTPEVPSNPNDPNSPKVPLEPKVPNDPTQGYIPPTLPSDPTKNIEITYKKIEGTVVVKYEDTEGNVLKEPYTDTASSAVGTRYNTAENENERPEEIIKEVDGRQVRYVRVPSLTVGAEEGQVQEGETVVKYVYQKVGNWIPLVPGRENNPPVNPYPFDPEHPDDPIKNPPTQPDGTPYVPYVPGYTPKVPSNPNDPNSPKVPLELVPNPSGNPNDPPVGYKPPVPTNPAEDIRIPYEPNPGTTTPGTDQEVEKGNLIVQYVDEQGNPLSPQESSEGNVGDPYNTSGKLIPGYLLIREPSNKNGTYVEGTTTVTYVYKKLGSWIPNIPIDHPEVPGTPSPYPNDPNGNPLVPVNPNDITEGYVPPVPTNPSEDTEIPYVKQGDLVVKYVDTEGNPISPEKTSQGDVGSPYTTTAKVILGYILVEEPANKDGSYTEGTTTVTYVYKKLGSWVPKIPDGDNPPKTPYPNNPVDPTDPGVPPVPYVPGHTPKDPNGNPLVPVNPNDITEGYVPPVPNNPGEDTIITYDKDPDPKPNPNPNTPSGSTWNKGNPPSGGGSVTPPSGTPNEPGKVTPPDGTTPNEPGKVTPPKEENPEVPVEVIPNEPIVDKTPNTGTPNKALGNKISVHKKGYKYLPKTGLFLYFNGSLVKK